VTRIAVLAALGFEIKGLAGALSAEKIDAVEGLSVRRAELGESEIYLVVTGMGKAVIPAAETALGALRPDFVVSTGTAGGLDPDLSTGAAVFATSLLRIESSITCAELHPPPGPFARARRITLGFRKTFGPFFHKCVTVGKTIVTPSEKFRLRQACGAGICEMESYFVAQEADRSGVPCITMRVVSDTSTDTLPRFEKFVTDNKVDKIRMAEHFAKYPDEAKRFADITRKSAEAVKRIPEILLPYLQAIAGS
jgi:adenosylhomocysteine nucleosidase